MGTFYWEPTWPEILAKQEETLRYPEFTRDTALELGLKIRDLVQSKYRGGAAIRILEDGMVIFSFKMAGTSAENDWWMDRKLAVSRMTGVSSLRAYVEAEAGLREAEWAARPDNFAACGGCFPVFRADGKVPCCHVLVSGLQHQEDHQVIADAMAWQLGAKIERVAG